MPRVSTHFGVQDPRLGSLAFPLIVPATIATAAATTLTTDSVLGGLILRDAAGAGRTDTLPTAADLAEAIQGVMVGTSFTFHVRNTAAGAFAITVAVGTGGTASGKMTIAQNFCKSFTIVFTNVTVGSEAYTCYSLGSVAV
jgi:hypothetical protein